MFIQSPSSPVRQALLSLFPDSPPAQRRAALRLWESAAGARWAAYSPLQDAERKGVEERVRAILMAVERRRPQISARVAEKATVVWASDPLLERVRAWLSPPASGALIVALQSALGSMDPPVLMRLLLPGAQAIGAPPALPWQEAARPGPVRSREWRHVWLALDERAPGLARSFASLLLAVLAAATIESLARPTEGSPMMTLAAVLLTGVWPIQTVHPNVLNLVDIGAFGGLE